MKILFVFICLTVYFSFTTSCNNKTNPNKTQNDSAIADTLYSWEYRYLMAFVAQKNDSLRIFDPQMMKGSANYDEFLKYDTALRLKILRLMRLPSLERDGESTVWYSDGTKDRPYRLTIEPRGIYAPIPTEYLLAFDNIPFLVAPLCPTAVRDVLSKMKKLEIADLTIMSMKPHVINLSGLDMRHIKVLHIIDPKCESIIFPKENNIQYLGIETTNIVELDTSFNHLVNLKWLYIKNVPLKQLDLKAFDKLDTLILERDLKASKINKLLVNQKPDLFIDESRFEFNNQESFAGRFWSNSSIKYSTYKKQVAAMKCDCE